MTDLTSKYNHMNQTHNTLILRGSLPGWNLRPLEEISTQNGPPKKN